MGSIGARVIGILVVTAAGCDGGVGTGGQRLPPLDATSVDFGAVVERTTKTVEVWVANPLSEPLELLPPVAAPPFGAALFQPVTVAVGDGVSLPLVFAPRGSGLERGEVVVRSPVGTVARFALSGRGVADEGLRCDERLDFGPELRGGPEVRGTFRCESASAGETRISVGPIGGDGRAAFRADDTGELRTIPAGGSFEVAVWYRPREYGSESLAWVELLREDGAERARVLLLGITE
jgi:hypothetical protein